MKPPPFAYHRPTTVAEAVATLADLGHDGKVLAGGQSLVPLLNMRLAAPAHLVDINRIAGLSSVSVDSGHVRVGALARHADVLREAAIPLLRQATAYVAHPAIRNRGTTVGSLVHADPAAEMPAVLAMLDGSVTLASADGTREVGAADFFLGPLESAVRPGELATSASFPIPPAGTGTAWLELSRRHGDYAMAGAGVSVTLVDGEISAARAGLISVGPTPVVVDLSPALAGDLPIVADWAGAGALAAAACDPEPDIHATAAYRRHLIAVLVARAGAAAARHAAGTGEAA